MPEPLTMALLAMGLANIGAQAIGGHKQSQHEQRMIQQQKKDQRRAAIERALGGTFWSKREDPVAPPNLAPLGIVQGLSQLGMQMAPGMMGQPGQPMQVPQGLGTAQPGAPGLTAPAPNLGYGMKPPFMPTIPVAPVPRGGRL